MLNESNLHGYQQRAAFNLLHNPSFNLWLDMGLGKTMFLLSPPYESARPSGSKNPVIGLTLEG